MAKDWLFGFLEDAGIGEVVYAEDEGVVTIDKRLRCWWCHKEIWPLMDQRKDEQGNVMHAYCHLSYQKAKRRA